MPRFAFVLILLAATATPAIGADITVYEEGDKYFRIGGFSQVQYRQIDPDSGNSFDDLFIRRLRINLEGSVHKDWVGMLQLNYGKRAGNSETTIKSVYLAYAGFKNSSVKVGNAKFPFSREYLTPSRYLHLVERTFVGNHNFGTPDRNLGVHVDGHNGDKRITWAASVARSDIDPSNNRLDFDTPLNANSDFNEGWILGGRLDFHPLGYQEFFQGDFSRENKVTIGVAAYGWDNNGDEESHAASIDSVVGLEISGAVRGKGISIDGQYNYFNVDTVDSAFTGGLYKNGETELENWAVEGGYMILPGKLELAAGYDSQDADNYQNQWTRMSIGANWYIKNNNIKLQITYRENENINGVEDNDADEIILQAQYVL